jgi:hypothetical protein
MGNLDEVLLEEDIGGFVGMFFYNTIEDIKDNCDIVSDTFGSLIMFDVMMISK